MVGAMVGPEDNFVLKSYDENQIVEIPHIMLFFVF
jgi:hypothetical protein